MYRAAVGPQEVKDIVLFDRVDRTTQQERCGQEQIRSRQAQGEKGQVTRATAKHQIQGNNQYGHQRRRLHQNRQRA